MSEGAEDQTQISGLCAWVGHGIIRQNKSPGGAGAGEWVGGKMRTLNWDMLNLMCPCDPQVEMSIRELLS